MEKSEIAAVAANVMYLESPESIDSSKSLFLDYGMSSIDFIDFAFEVKSRSGKGLGPDQLWPVNSMMTNPDNFGGGRWTETGLKRLQEIFAGAELPENPGLQQLSALFSVDFVARRVSAA